MSDPNPGPHPGNGGGAGSRGPPSSGPYVPKSVRFPEHIDEAEAPTPSSPTAETPLLPPSATTTTTMGLGRPSPASAPHTPRMSLAHPSATVYHGPASSYVSSTHGPLHHHALPHSSLSPPAVNVDGLPTASTSPYHPLLSTFAKPPTTGSRPQRTTKTTQKLVILPEDDAPPPISATQGISNLTRQVSHDAAQALRQRPEGFHEGQAIAESLQRRTQAETMAKDSRGELPRVTSLCLADGFRMRAIAAHLNMVHGVKTRTWDEALYAAYDERAKLSLDMRVPGSKAANIKARTVDDVVLPPDLLTGPVSGGPSCSSSYDEASMLKQWTDPLNDTQSAATPGDDAAAAADNTSSSARRPGDGENGRAMVAPRLQRRNTDTDVMGADAAAAAAATGETSGEGAGHVDNVDSADSTAIVEDWMLRSELFIFDYGVVVFWNWSPEEEAYFRRLLAQFATHPFKVDDIEVEDFHFQYDLNGPIQPRIFNDMITLKSASPLIKLTISHACAQSVKLTLYENMMEETIEGTLPLPQMLSKYGEVKMSRNDVMRIIGKLFSLRMEVNLVSNVLDTPEIFWFEPELDGLYNAIRGYLEISQRAVVLNSRASVLSDMLSMLSEHMNSKEMTNITVIIILLILLACVIAVAEVYVKVLRVRAGME